jgi:predicted DNA-binding transcriptional regulator YafY
VADPKQEVLIDYTNWRGERAMRRIRPLGTVTFENNEWHPETQWLLEAVDLETMSNRTFAMANIHSWRSIDQGAG